MMLTLAEANRANKPAYVLMNQVPPNSPKLIRQKQVLIQQEYEIAVLSKCLSRRVDFEYCDEKGLSAAEYNPNGQAAEEILRLYTLIQSIFITLKPKTTPVRDRIFTPEEYATPEPSGAYTSIALPREVSLPKSSAVPATEESNVHRFLPTPQWNR